MEVSLLLDLPADVVGSIMTFWLGLKCLLKIDSAYCNKSNRLTLLEVFRFLNRESDVFQPSCKRAKWHLRWVNSRAIGMHKLILSNKCEHSIVQNYLSNHGKNIRQLELWNYRTTTFPRIRSYELFCTQLQSIVFEEFCLNGNLTLRSPTVTSIWITSAKRGNYDECSHSREIDVSACSSLQTLYVNDEVDSCWSIIPPSSGSLQRLSQILSPDIIALLPPVKFLFNLTTLALTVRMSERELVSVLKACPLIVHLDISGANITDDEFDYFGEVDDVVDINQALTERQNPLRTLCCSRFLSDALLYALAKHCADNLEVLVADQCCEMTARGLTAVLESCVRLHTLAMPPAVTNDTSFDYTLLRNIRTLLVSDPTARCFESIAAHCDKLVTLLADGVRLDALTVNWKPRSNSLLLRVVFRPEQDGLKKLLLRYLQPINVEVNVISNNVSMAYSLFDETFKCLL